MTTLTLFKEYNWLIDTIHRARYISLRELNEQWVETEMSGGVEMSRMTFFRHKCDIEGMFGVQIDRTVFCWSTCPRWWGVWSLLSLPCVRA